MKKDYDFKIDKDKTLEEQNLSSEARAIIANIFKKYWATDYQKQRILEKEKYEKYNPDNIFKNKKTEEFDNTNEVALIENKESFITKIVSKIKNFFAKLKMNG